MLEASNHTELELHGAYPQVEPLIQLRHIARQLQLFKPRLARSDQAGGLLTRYRAAA